MDAMGAQKNIAARIVEKKADYILALKGNQGSLFEDARLFLDDPDVLEACLVSSTLDAGHGRIEERTCRATDDIARLRERHPEWKGLHWTLDVTFREDACRCRKDNAALNLSLIRKTAINLIKQDKSCKLPLKRKRLKAAMDPEYRAMLIGR